MMKNYRTQSATQTLALGVFKRWCALIGAVCIIAFALALGSLATTPRLAHAENIQLDAPVTVSDDITRLHVNKLDADTHEYVVGATMAIINEETGEVVDSWVTGTFTHENEKMLNVGVTYILRELAAPAGYDAVPDVRFRVKELEGKGIEILSGADDVELTESYKLAVYDKRQPQEQVTTVRKPEAVPPTGVTTPQAPERRDGATVNPTPSTPSSSSSSTTTSVTPKTPENTSKVVAPKTGDETPLSLVAALMAVGVSLILILQLVKRRLD